MVPKAGIEIDHDKLKAELTLGFKITADPKKQPYVVEVTIRGRFAIKTGTVEHLEQFAKSGAASVLFPFVRQMIYTVTRDAMWGPLLINPINLQAVLRWQDETPQNATASSELSQP